MFWARVALVSFLSNIALGSDSEDLENLKRKLLFDLGMRRVPDMSRVNTTRTQVQRMTRKYYRSRKKSEEDFSSFQPTDCDSGTSVTFHLDIVPYSLVRGATLVLPNSTLVDFTRRTRQWVADREGTLLKLPCRGCCGARLEVASRSTSRRQKRSACGRGECCRRSLRISFRDIGWDWIVLPHDFEAFRCTGRCAGDSSHDFASTHALIQSLLSSNSSRGKGGRRVPRPCCAPRKLRPLDLLHYNDQDPPELVVTKQKGMVVRECACS